MARRHSYGYNWKISTFFVHFSLFYKFPSKRYLTWKSLGKGRIPSPEKLNNSGERNSGLFNFLEGKRERRRGESRDIPLFVKFVEFKIE